MSLLLLFSGGGSLRSGIVRLGGILLTDELLKEENDDELVFEIIRRFFEAGLA